MIIIIIIISIEFIESLLQVGHSFVHYKSEVVKLSVMIICQDVKLRSRAYVAMGRIGKRLPLLFSTDIGLVQSLFDAMAEVYMHTHRQT